MNFKFAGSLCNLTKQSVSRFLPEFRSVCRLSTIGGRINCSGVSGDKIVFRTYAQSSSAPAASSKTGCLTCLRLSLSDCPRISLPGCRKARSSTKCVKFSPPRDCQPLRAPYSSYHECGNKKPVRKADLDDCRCFGKEKNCGQRQLFWGMNNGIFFMNFGDNKAAFSRPCRCLSCDVGCSTNSSSPKSINTHANSTTSEGFNVRANVLLNQHSI